jgi:hypothetical protein
MTSTLDTTTMSNEQLIITTLEAMQLYKDNAYVWDNSARFPSDYNDNNNNRGRNTFKELVKTIANENPTSEAQIKEIAIGLNIDSARDTPHQYYKGEGDTGEYLSILATEFGFDDYDETHNADILYSIDSLGKHTTIYWTFTQVADYIIDRLPDEATCDEVTDILYDIMDERIGFKRSESALKHADYLWEKDFNKLPAVAKAVANYILDTMAGNYEGYDNTSTLDDMKTDFLIYCETWEENNNAFADYMHYVDFQDLMLCENYDNQIKDDDDNIIEYMNLHHLFIKLLNEVGFYQYANSSDLSDIKDFCEHLKTQSLVYKYEEE